MADTERWGNPRSYLPEWIGRAHIIARYLHGCDPVLDLGAGTQSLRPLVKARYIPADVVSLGPDTLTIDFDGQWSADDLPAVEGVAIAGLLEHVKDPLGVIRKLRGVGKVWAVSYMDSTRHRHKLVTLRELEQAFADAGKTVQAVERWNGQNVYRLT